STLALRVPHLWTISLTCCLFPTPPTIDISTLSLHDALPILDGVYISEKVGAAKPSAKIFEAALRDLGLTDRSKVLVVGDDLLARSEEHTSELQSRFDLVCRLLLEKKKEFPAAPVIRSEQHKI